MTTILDHLQSISRDLDRAIDELETLELAATKAESAYRIAKAKAYMVATGAVQAREYQAVIAAEVELVERDSTASQVRVQRARINALHSRIDVGRSVASAEKLLAGVVT